MKRRGQSGFTLVELMVTVAIIAITVTHYNVTHELTFDIQTLVHTRIDPASHTRTNPGKSHKSSQNN